MVEGSKGMGSVRRRHAVQCEGIEPSMRFAHDVSRVGGWAGQGLLALAPVLFRVQVATSTTLDGPLGRPWTRLRPAA